MTEYKPGPMPSSFSDDGTKARLGVEVPRWMVSRLSNLLMKGLRRPLYNAITHSLIGYLESPQKNTIIYKVLRMDVGADNFIVDPLEWLDHHINEYLEFKNQSIEDGDLEAFRAYLTEKGMPTFKEKR